MKVLVVEDEALIGRVLEDELSEAGHTIIGPVASAPAALMLAQAEQPALALIDLDVSDSTAPGDLARTLKERFGVTSLFLACDAKRAQPFADVALGVIAKPFDMAELPAALDVAVEVLAGGEPPPPPIPTAMQIFG